jgi:hypothetical protein
MEGITGATGLIKAAGEIADGKIGSALFLPSAKALGDYWGELTAERIDKWKKSKEAKNLSDHSKAVAEELGEEVMSNAYDDPLIIEWAEQAAKFDESEADLAAAWRGVLTSIATKAANRRAILELAKSLTPSETISLLKWYSKNKYVRDSSFFIYTMTDVVEHKKIINI